MEAKASSGSRVTGGCPGSPLFWVKKEKITERGKARRRAEQSLAPHLTQSLDPPLKTLNVFDETPRIKE